MRLLLGTLVLAGGLSAQQVNPPSDPVRTVAGRLELERYKAHIKGLFQVPVRDAFTMGGIECVANLRCIFQGLIERQRTF